MERSPAENAVRADAPAHDATAIADARTLQSAPGRATPRSGEGLSGGRASTPSGLGAAATSTRARDARVAAFAGLADARLATMPIKIGDVVNDKYLVERVLGEGGAGVVVAATNLDLDEPVALKFLKPEMCDRGEVVTRFAREAKAAASIKSEHVAKVLDVGQTADGAPFIVMEYLDGEDLFRLVRAQGPLAIADATEWVMQACEALAVAHARGIVHRDVKPENLFLVRADHGGLPTVKVLDFGISKSALTGAFGVDAAAFRTSHQVGTPAYMSPEQVRSAAEVDARSDIFSLGLVLYELLTGRHAFFAKTVPEMCAAILEQTPRAVDAIRPEVPRALARVVERCLAKRPEDRFADVASLAAALLPFAPPRARISVERASAMRKSSEPDAVDATRAGRPSDPSDSAQLPLAAVRTFQGVAPPRGRGVPLVWAFAALLTITLVAFLAWPDRSARTPSAQSAAAAPPKATTNAASSATANDRPATGAPTPMSTPAASASAPPSTASAGATARSDAGPSPSARPSSAAARAKGGAAKSREGGDDDLGF
jgi:serine/threonine protein kinase